MYDAKHIAPSRFRFLRVLMVLLVVDALFTLALMLSYPIPPQGLMTAFLVMLWGPFAAFVHSSARLVANWPIVASVSLLLFAYLISPSRMTYALSMLGTVIWISAGCVFLFMVI